MKHESIEDALVVRALREVGENVTSVYDLVNTKRSYKAAIPVLIDLLPKINDPLVKEGIVRALAVKEAVSDDKAIGRLIEEFRKIAPEDRSAQMLKWAIGNTLSVIARDAQYEQIAALIREEGHGKAMEMIVLALGHMKKQSGAVDVLIDLLNDESLAGHAAMALRKLKAKCAKTALERSLSHPRDWVRNEVTKALKAICRN